MDTRIARKGDSPLLNPYRWRFRIPLGGVSLFQLNLYSIPEMLPNDLKRLADHLFRQISGNLLGDVQHGAGGPSGHDLAREPHRSRHGCIARRERGGQHRMGRSSHPTVPTTLPADLG
ncbi:hypothetical protein [Nonomuraea rhizosphaerae]|uniref:hypothetical protein n=1 Tax=Nonomuraea rhizosphaerae TaxID=2665663 RepID=UPI001C600E81|nr:hypothetical protein [Nonomuraea rhizosphaerae]